MTKSIVVYYSWENKKNVTICNGLVIVWTMETVCQNGNKISTSMKQTIGFLSIICQTGEKSNCLGQNSHI